MTDKTEGWGWWHARSEEDPHTGPFSTRDEAIEDAVGSGNYDDEDDDGTPCHLFSICDARQDPLRLADWIRADLILECAEENLHDDDRICPEYDDGPFFKATPDQDRDLQSRIKAACDEWQAAHGLVFSANTFSAQRNQENIMQPASTQGGAA